MSGAFAMCLPSTTHSQVLAHLVFTAALFYKETEAESDLLRITARMWQKQDIFFIKSCI